jgi:hypothetical protein
MKVTRGLAIPMPQELRSGLAFDVDGTRWGIASYDVVELSGVAGILGRPGFGRWHIIFLRGSQVFGRRMDMKSVNG